MNRTIQSRTIRSTLLALALWPAFAFAQAQPATVQYPEWDQLTPAQRDALVAPLRERWNGNPDERVRMFERAQRWKSMPRDQRDRARRGMKRWEHMDPAKRAEMQALFERTRGMPRQQQRETFALYHAMREMTPAQRETLKQQWAAMTPEQRAEWMHDNAPHGHNRGR